MKIYQLKMNLVLKMMKLEFKNYKIIVIKIF